MSAAPAGAALRRAAGLAIALVLIASGAAGASAKPKPARLAGKFAMHGRLTTVDNVYGERQGQRIQRTWTFLPKCAVGSCRRVLLKRRRSGRHKLDLVLLIRQAPGLYVGRGSFWVALRCAGQVVKHGGIATETITVRITRTALVGTTPFVTAIRATYSNPSRQNLTSCPGGIGHDAANYRGRLASPLPGPPTASFTASPNPATNSATFTDHSTSGGGGAPIVAWSWNFGDPASATNTSTARDPAHQFSAPGVYSVTLRVRDRYGQTATSSAQVTV